MRSARWHAVGRIAAFPGTNAPDVMDGLNPIGPRPSWHVAARRMTSRCVLPLLRTAHQSTCVLALASRVGGSSIPSLNRSHPFRSHESSPFSHGYTLCPCRWDSMPLQLKLVGRQGLFYAGGLLGFLRRQLAEQQVPTATATCMLSMLLVRACLPCCANSV